MQDPKVSSRKHGLLTKGPCSPKHIELKGTALPKLRGVHGFKALGHCCPASWENPKALTLVLRCISERLFSSRFNVKIVMLVLR